jgi:beta-glucosidase-like glycosyl hydrolase
MHADLTSPSHTQVNGVPACANDFLLRTLLRDSWGFEGYVVSDCDAVDTIYSNQYVCTHQQCASAPSLDVVY